MKFCQFVLKILSGNKILAYIKCHNSGKNLQKTMCTDLKIDVVSIYAYFKFGEILSIGLKILSGN